MLILLRHSRESRIVAGVQNTPDAAAKSGNANTNVVYTFTLVNTGNASDTFTITKSGEVWTTVISDTSHTLAAAAETTFNVTVSVPETADDAETDGVTIVATSGNDPAVSDSDGLTTTAVAIPKVVGTPVLWLDASQITGLSNNDPITTWSDLSASDNDVTQATADAKPTYKTGILNGLPVARFDGGDYLAKVLGVALSQPLTFFAVFTTDGDVTTNEQLDGGNDLTTRCVPYVNSGAFNAYGGANITGDAVSINTSYYVVVIFNGASSSIKLSGASATTGNAGTQTHGGFTIGADYTFGLQWGGDIAELGWYNASLSGANVATLESYLAAKWGL